MKSIPYIILAYFQQHLLNAIGMSIGLFLFIGAHIRLLSKGSIEPQVFFLCILVITFSIALHTKRLIMSNAGALLPY